MRFVSYIKHGRATTMKPMESLELTTRDNAGWLGADGTARGEATAFTARVTTLRAALHAAVRATEVEGPGSAVAAHADALMLDALAMWRRLRAEQERAAAEEAMLFKTKTRANSILSETVWCGSEVLQAMTFHLHRCYDRCPAHTERHH